MQCSIRGTRVTFSGSNTTYTAFAGTVAGGLFPVAIITPPKNICNGGDVVSIRVLNFCIFTNVPELIRVRRADPSNVWNIDATLATIMLYMEILHRSSIWFVEMPWLRIFLIRCVCVMFWNDDKLWKFESRWISASRTSRSETEKNPEHDVMIEEDIVLLSAVCWYFHPTNTTTYLSA